MAGTKVLKPLNLKEASRDIIQGGSDLISGTKIRLKSDLNRQQHKSMSEIRDAREIYGATRKGYHANITLVFNDRDPGKLWQVEI